MWRWALAVAAVPLLALAACDDGEPTSAPTGAESTPADPTGETTGQPPTATDTAAPDDEGPTTAAGDPLAAALAAAEPEAPVGETGTGRVPTVDAEIEVGVVALTSFEDETVLVWGLRSADGQEHQVDYLRGLDDSGNDPQEDVRAVRLELPDESLLLTSTLGQGDRQELRAVDCLCSRLPNRVTGEWTILRNRYGPLPEGTEFVTVQLPGIGSYDDGISLEVAVQQQNG